MNNATVNVYAIVKTDSGMMARIPDIIIEDIDLDGDIIEQISGALRNDYDLHNVESFDWKINKNDEIDDELDEKYSSVAEFANEIKAVLRKYFEGYDEYDPKFSAQDAVDQIKELVGEI